MEELTVKELKKQHFDSYKDTLLSIIENNTNILVNEDIKSLISKPPLDSMDVLKNKFLDLSKKNKIILDISELSVLLDNYRESLNKICDEIKKERVKVLSNKVNSFKYKDGEVYEKIINKKINKIFDKDIDETIKEKIINDVNKFINKTYLKQIMDSFDIKVLVKDTILINSINEQNERYIFVLNNSRVFTMK